MSCRRLALFAFLAVQPFTASAMPIASVSAAVDGHPVLAYVNKNLAKGRSNFYGYITFSNKHVEIKKGDALVYDVFLDPKNPEPKGGVDVDMQGIQALREFHVPDQNGIDSHGDGLLTPAVGKWYHRRIPMDVVAGHTTDYFDLCFEGDSFGQYAQFVDNVAIEHADGSRTAIFPTPDGYISHGDSTNGYSSMPSLATVDRSVVSDGGSVDGVVAQVIKKSDRLRALGDFDATIALTEDLLKTSPDPKVQAAVDRGQAAIRELRSADNLTDDQFNKGVATAKSALDGAAPFLKSFGGYEVGHAHIDVQWLWESQESLQAAHDTWLSAVNFMDKYPQFCFTQSSAGYYREVQYTWPDLFERIKKYVKQGRWEIVGGRECEADENLISPEAHARHFLYGQRYFRDTFGKTAVVGWEPDTFGHTAQMPQILRLGGCDYFYFCRGGKGQPLFQWEALDGSKVLTYDQVAAGAWYNTDLDNNVLKELPPYVAKTGQKSMMWVYGVGNHGGGPTKEHLDVAEKWKTIPAFPTTKFSTAEGFFKQAEKAGTENLPTIKSELEGVFLGCYTTNAMVKRMNRQAEAQTVQAEAVASVANYLGNFPYPGQQFAKNWEKITFNQHHDTICGSSFHWAYLQTVPDFNAVIASDKDIQRDALVNLSVQVTPREGGENFMVFNSNGWARDGWVSVRLPSHLLGGGPDQKFGHPVAVAPDGTELPLMETDPVTHEARFYAKGVPAFGYRVYVLKEGKATPKPVASSGYTVENENLKVTFDPGKGNISSLIDKRTGKELAGPKGLGTLENHGEKPSIEAWDLGEIVSVEPVRVLGSEPVSGPDFAGMRTVYEIPPSKPGLPPTRMQQVFTLNSGSDKVEVEMDANWQVVSQPDAPSPLLRAAFDVAAPKPTATYEVPFGAVSRPTDGAEVPAQAWADVSGANGGITVVEDCKHGFSCTGSTLRMSILRGNREPDMLPNRGAQHLSYAIVPHTGDWKEADGARRAADLEAGLLSVQIPPDCKGDRPQEFSFASVTDSSVVPTCLKLGEDGKGYVVRAYQSTGKASVGSLQLAGSADWAKIVNFVEDLLGNGSASGKSVDLVLRPWEIKTVEVGVAKPKPIR